MIFSNMTLWCHLLKWHKCFTWQWNVKWQQTQMLGLYCRTNYTHARMHARTHTHTHPFNGPLSGTTQVSQYQKGKTNLDFTEAWDSEWQWHQLGHMQVCTSLQTDNHTSTPPVSFFTGRMPFLPPNQQRQSTEGTVELITVIKQIFLYCSLLVKIKQWWLYRPHKLDNSEIRKKSEE